MSSDAELIMLDLSSESMLEMLLVLERIDGLNRAVLGSPLIRNSDDGEGAGVSYSLSFSWDSSSRELSPVFDLIVVARPGSNRD